MNKFLVIIFFFSSLFDWYNVEYGVRVFDLLIVFSILLYSISLVDLKLYNYNFIMLFFVPGIILGIISGKMQHVVFFLFAYYIFFNLFLNAEFDKDKVLKQIRVIILIHVLAYFLQYVIFHLYGASYIDYRELLGMRPLRVWIESTHYFRSSGLYEEPNSYAVSLYMLCILYYVLKRKIDGVLIVACVTMMLSESLWGIGAVLVIIGIISFDKGINYIYAVTFSLALILVITIDSNVNFILSGKTYKRLDVILTDGSFIARYGIDLANVSLFPLLFGHGLGVDGYHSSFGGNGYSAIIYYFGLTGLLGFLFLFYRLAGTGVFFVAIVFILSTTPMIFYFMFWGWLALVYRYNNLQVRKKSCDVYGPLNVISN